MSDGRRLTYTVEEAARLCGVSRGVAYRAVRDGELPSVRLQRRVLIPRHALEQMLGELPTNLEGGGQIEEANGPAASASASRRGDVDSALGA